MKHDARNTKAEEFRKGGFVCLPGYPPESYPREKRCCRLRAGILKRKKLRLKIGLKRFFSC